MATTTTSSRKRKAPTAEQPRHSKPGPELRPHKKARRRSTRLARIAHGIAAGPATNAALPVVPEASIAPEAPIVPETPVVPETPAVQETPAALEIPVVPDTTTPLNAVPNPKETLSVFVFGDGEMGGLGLGTKVTEAKRPKLNPFLDPTKDTAFHVTRIACGGMHNIVLTNDNKIVTWGVNDCHALGRNTDWDGGLRDADAEDSDEEGDLNPLESTPMAVDSAHFAPGIKFVSVAAGDNCSLVLTDEGHVYAWGTFRDPDGKEAFGYAADGSKIIKQPTPVLVAGLQNITQIACGENHALALDNTGTIWGWGTGGQNQFLSVGTASIQDTLRPLIVRPCENKVKYIASGPNHCFAIDDSDKVWGWGLNNFGQAGHAASAGGDEAFRPEATRIDSLCGRNVIQLAGGGSHSVAVTAAGECFVWGRMDGGQLGIEFMPEQLADETLFRRDERGKPRICLVPTAVPGLGKVVQVGCGTDHTIIINDEGKAFSTGFGTQNQLGLGQDEDVFVATQIKGKAINDEKFVWAGAGGQFSAIASTRPEATA